MMANNHLLAASDRTKGDSRSKTTDGSKAWVLDAETVKGLDSQAGHCRRLLHHRHGEMACSFS
jgi:hypothetical protein